MNFSRKILLFAGAVALAGTLLGHNSSAQDGPRRSLLVLSKKDHTLAIVDPATLKAVARVPVGDDPHEVIASSDGRTAYVSNYGRGAFHTLAVVDLIGQKPLPAIDVAPLDGPHGLAFADGRVWFTSEMAKAVGGVNSATGKLDWVMGLGQDRTHMIQVTPDAKRVYATNVNSATVSILELLSRKEPQPAGQPGAPATPPPPAPQMDWYQTVVKVGPGSEGFDVTPDGRELWTANALDGTVSIIDLGTKKVTETLDPKVKGANRLRFSRDGRLVLISSASLPDLTVLDAATHREVKRIPIGHGAAGILVDPDGTRAYVACTPDDYVAVIDLKTLAVIGHIDAGGAPDGMAWAQRP